MLRRLSLLKISVSELFSCFQFFDCLLFLSSFGFISVSRRKLAFLRKYDFVLLMECLIC